MPKFSKSSLSKLETAHPDLQAIMHEAIKEYDFKVIHGTRTPEEQFELFKVGRKEYSPGKWKVVGKTVTQLDGYNKKSRHNYTPSLAVDVVPYPIDWYDIERFEEMAKVIKKIANRLGIKITWGGDWKRFKDYPHFQLDIKDI